MEIGIAMAGEDEDVRLGIRDAAPRCQSPKKPAGTQPSVTRPELANGCLRDHRTRGVLASAMATKLPRIPQRAPVHCTEMQDRQSGRPPDGNQRDRRATRLCQWTRPPSTPIP